MITLGWEKNHPERSAWTKLVSELIGGELFDSFDKAQDATSFHPQYNSLTKSQKVNVWAELVSIVSFYESGWKPGSAMVETSMGTDPLTGKQVASEGLLQLSYQDAVNWKSTLEKSSRKIDIKKQNILDPFVNLECGIRIMARLIERDGVVAKGNKSLSRGAARYWSVLREGHKIDKIKAVTSALNFGSDEATPWMDIAKKELGQKEISGSKHNPRVLEYHKATSLKAKDDETAWCSSFVNFCLKSVGYKTTNSAWARSWTEYGQSLSSPKYGCICVVERNAPGGDSHVFFWVGEDDKYIHALGGNQSNSVSIQKSSYLKKDLLAYRWPVKGAS